MDAFRIRDDLVDGFRSYIKSYVDVRDARMREVRDGALDAGLHWLEPLLHFTPNFPPGGNDQIARGEVVA